MKRLLISFILLLVTTCHAGDWQEITHPYWPLTVGARIGYDLYDVTAKLDRFVITPDSMAYSTSITVEIRESDPSPFHNGARFKNDFWLECGTGFNEGLGWIGNVGYIGEAINELGLAMTVPEPKLTLYPLAGETLAGTTYAYESPNSLEYFSSCRFLYRTVCHLDSWGSVNDVWVTFLYEQCAKKAYNFYFARGVGMIGLYWLDLTTGRGQAMIANTY